MTTPHRFPALALVLLASALLTAPTALARGPHRARGILPGEPRVQIQVHRPYPRRYSQGRRVLRGAGIFFGAAILAAALAAEAEPVVVEPEVYYPPQPVYREPVYQQQPIYRPAPSRRGPPPDWIPEGANQARRYGPPAARQAQPETFDEPYDTEGYDGEGDDYNYDDAGEGYEAPGASAPAAPDHGSAAPARVYRPSSRQPAPEASGDAYRPGDPWAGGSADEDREFDDGALDEGSEGDDGAFDEGSEDDDGAFDDMDPQSSAAPVTRPLAALVPADAAPALPAFQDATPAAQSPEAPTAKSKDRLGAKARTALAAELLSLVNAARDAQGAAPLEPNAALAAAATAHSEEMARLKYFGHDSPVAAHPRFTQRIKEAGVTRYGVASENLAKSAASATSAKDLLDLWLKSPAHRDALLNPAYQVTGIGIWSDGQHVYATQLFADYIEQR